MAYHSLIKVRFGDEDHAGIVYYPRFFDFFHRAKEDFFEDAGTAYRDVLDVDLAGWPAVHIESDFLSPVRFGDVLDVEVLIHRIGRSSVTFGYVGRVEGREVAKARITVACIDMRTFRSRPIPDKYRRLFEEHLVPDGD